MVSVFSISASAIEEIFVVSIEKTIQPSEVSIAIDDLKNFNVLDELDIFKVNLLRYLTDIPPTPDVSCFGIAYLHISYIRVENRNKYLDFILHDDRFTLLRILPPGGPIPEPSVTGNN
jgi:hypothetical protein